MNMFADLSRACEQGVFLSFMTIFELGSLVCAVSKTSHAFIAGRAVAGVGGAGLTNGALVMLSAGSPPKLRPLLTAFGISMLSIGTVVGPLIGGALTQQLTWRWCEFQSPFPFPTSHCIDDV